MNPKEYLTTVLKNQQLSKESQEYKQLMSRGESIKKKIESAFKDSKINIDYGGSIAKGTIILEDYDLDLIAYFENNDTSAGESLEDIYKNVKVALQDDYMIDEKKSSLRLKGKSDAERNIDFHIDVVPGRYTDETKQDVFLYQLNGDKKRLKTNLKKHIDHVKKSGLVDVISLVKLWRIRRNLSIKTFVLELLVIKILEDVDRGFGIDQKLKLFWETLRDKKGNISIEDPANPQGNDLSVVWDTSVQNNLSTIATMTLNTIEHHGWEDVFGTVKQISLQEKMASIQIATSHRSDRARPWSC